MRSTEANIESPLATMLNSPMISIVALSGLTFYTLKSLLFPYNESNNELQTNLDNKYRAMTPQRKTIPQNIRYRSTTFSN